MEKLDGAYVEVSQESLKNAHKDFVFQNEFIVLKYDLSLPMIREETHATQ